MAQSNTIRLIDLRTGSVQEIPNSGGVVTAIGASDLYLDDLSSSAILGTMRVGDDLIINLANGGQIIVRDFFAFSRTGEVLDEAGVPMAIGTDSGNSSSGGVMSATTGGAWFAGLTVAALLLSDAYDDDQAKTNPATPPDGPGGGGPTDAEQALALINAYDGTNTAPTVATYNTAGVTGVTADNLAGVNAQVAASANNALTVADIDPFVTTTNAALATINAYDGTNTAPTADDYANAGVTVGEGGITADNLAGVNAQVAASTDDSLTAEDIEGFIAATAASQATITAWDGTNTAPTADDYRNVGVTGVTADNVAGVNARLAALSETQTLEQINTLVEEVSAALTTINNYPTDSLEDAPTADTYTAAGVTGVTLANLGGVNTQVAAAGDDTVTAADIQGFVAATNSAWATINAYDGTNSAPDADDYTNAGIVGVTEANVSVVNEQLAAAEDELNAQDLINLVVGSPSYSLTKITNYDQSSDPTPTAADYAVAGVRNFDAARLSLINELLLNANDNSSIDEHLQFAQNLVDIIADVARVPGVLPANATSASATIFNSDNSFVLGIDHNDDNTANWTVRVTIAEVPNSNGNLVERSLTYVNAAGTTVRTESYTVNSDGVRITTAIDGVDANDNGTLETSEFSDGTLDRTLLDVNADGTVDQTTFEDDDRRVEEDINLDGTVDRIGHDDAESGTDHDGTSAGDGIIDRTTMLFQIITDDGLVLTDADNNGTIELVQVTDANVQLRGQDYEAYGITKNLHGITDIRLDESGISNLTLNAIDVNAYFARQSDDTRINNYQLTVQGGTDDRVNLVSGTDADGTVGGWVARDANSDGTIDTETVGTGDNAVTYAIYDVRYGDTTIGSARIQQGVTVVDAEARIKDIDNEYDDIPATVLDYTAYGVTGVTDANLAEVNRRVASSRDTDLTRMEIQALVTAADAALPALAKFVAYDGTAAAPTLEDYALLGVTGAGAGRISLVNALVAATNLRVNGDVEDDTAKYEMHTDDTSVNAITPEMIQALANTAADMDDVFAALPAAAATTVTTEPSGADEAFNRYVIAIDTNGDGSADRSVTVRLDQVRTQVQLDIDEDEDGMTDDISLDLDGDGMADDLTLTPDERTVSFALDPLNTPTRIDYDLDNDGTADMRQTFNYDSTNRRIDVDIDSNADGTTDRREVYEYDMAGQYGRVTAIHFHDDGNVHSDPDRSVRYTLDAAGHRTASMHDNNGDGTADEIRTYQRNSSAQVTRTSFYTDGTNDGSPDRIETYTLNAAGHRTGVSIDTNNDGSANRTETYTVNAAGLRTAASFDTNADGTADRIETYTLNSAGERTAASFYDNGTNDGTPERIETYELNGAGHQISITFYDDGTNDGSPDRIHRFSVDDRGQSTLVEQVNNAANGTAEETVTTHSNSQLSLQLTEYDGDNGTPDGVTDRTQTHFLNGAGQRFRTDTDADADGRPNNIEIYTLNAAGDRIAVETRIDSNDDGTADRIEYDTVADDAADGTADGTSGGTADGTADRTEIRQLSSSGGGLLTDQDINGTIELVQLQANADFTLAATYTESGQTKQLTGLADIRLNGYTASELTLSADLMRQTIAIDDDGMNDPMHDLLIQGGDDDTVFLTGTWAVRAGTEEVDGVTYTIYDARHDNGTVGAVLVQQGVEVLHGTALTTFNDALEKINNHTTSSSTQQRPTVADYTAVRVSGVDGNLTAVNDAVAAATNNSLRPADIREIVTTAVLAKINAYDGDGTPATPTVADYQAAGVIGVDADNRADINSAVLASTITTLDADDIQALVATDVLADINAYAGSGTGPLVTDYRAIGVTGVTGANLEDVNAEVAASTNTALTAADIQGMVADTALTLINAYNGDGTTDVPTVADYLNIGVGGVTADNLPGVDRLLLANTDPVTAHDIRLMVAQVDAALKTITDYDGTSGAPTVQDYETAGLSDDNSVTAEYDLASINAWVAASTDSHQTHSELQAGVTALVRINGFRQATVPGQGIRDVGQPTVADYEALGFTNVTAAHLYGINNQVADNNEDGNLTLAAIGAFVTATTGSFTTINAYDGTSATTAPTLADYANVGPRNMVNEDTLPGTNALVGASTDTDLTREELEVLIARVEAAIIRISAYRNDQDRDAPEAEHYSNAGVTGVTTANVAAVNAALVELETEQEGNFPSIDEINAMVVAVRAAIAALKKINDYRAGSTNDEPELADYQALLGEDSGVTAANLEGVNEQVEDATTALTAADIPGLIRAAALAKINDYRTDSSNPPTLADYEDLLGADSGITADNLAAINTLVDEADNALTAADIHEFIALDVINDYDGTGTALTYNNYVATGVTGVYAHRINLINALVAATSNDMVDSDELQYLVDIAADIEYALGASALPANAEFTVQETTGGTSGFSIEIEVGDSTDVVTVVTSDTASNSGAPETISYNTDGTAGNERIDTFSYDANGRRTMASFDTNNDDAADRIETYTVNAAGHRTETRINTDPSANNAADEIQTHMVNAAGHRIRTDFNTDATGSDERQEVYVRTDSGGLAATIYDTDADGSAERFEFGAGDNNAGVEHTLLNTYSGISLVGLDRIVMHGPTASELTIDSATLDHISGGSGTYRLNVEGHFGDIGDTADSVVLTGDWTRVTGINPPGYPDYTDGSGGIGLSHAEFIANDGNDMVGILVIELPVGFNT